MRAHNIWTKSLHFIRISAYGDAEAALFGRGRKGTRLNRNEVSMAASDTCEVIQQLTDITFIYEGCMYHGSTFFGY